MKKKIVVLLVAVAVLSMSASAAVLVYEPFAYYGATELTGQGGAWGTTGVWNSSAANDPAGWGVHMEGSLSGALLSTEAPVTYDGTVDGLWTMGGYAGHGSDGYKLNADIALAPRVTASFQSGTTTWISHVSVASFDKNVEMPNVVLGTDPFPTGSRGENNPGSGFGTGGGPNRNNRSDIYPMFYTDGQYNNEKGAIPGNSYSGVAETTVDNAFRAATDEVNIVVMKIDWDAGANGEDIISLARFLEGEELSEAAFNAINVSILSDIDQSQLDTLTIAGIKFFVDEIRIGTSFGDVAPCPEPMTLALLGLGGLLIRRRK